MFNTRRDEEPYSRAEAEFISKYVSNPSYNLVPESIYHGEEQRANKESMYSHFVNHTSPDEYNGSTFERDNRNEADHYHNFAEREGVISIRTGERILRMQASDVYEVDCKIAAAGAFVDYLKTLI